MREAVWAEALKVRRARLPWLTVLAFAVVATVCGFFMFVLADPARARELGLLGDKAQLSGASADWPGFLGLLGQATGVSGLLIYGMTGIWLFGREFSDHTAKDLLALPTSRTSVVLAKFLVGALWAAALTAQTVLLGLVIGTVLGLPGEVAAGEVVRLPVIAVMTWLLTTPLSLAASLGRGYLAAVGVLFVIVFCAQIITALGFGAYFPWSVPGLYAGLGGTAYDPPGVVGYLLVVLVGVAGVAATAIWWERADHTR